MIKLINNDVFNPMDCLGVSIPLSWALYLGLSNISYEGKFGNHYVNVQLCTTSYKFKPWILITVKNDPYVFRRQVIFSIDPIMGRTGPMFSCENYRSFRRSTITTQDEPLLKQLWHNYDNFWRHLRLPYMGLISSQIL